MSQNVFENSVWAAERRRQLVRVRLQLAALVAATIGCIFCYHYCDEQSQQDPYDPQVFPTAFTTGASKRVDLSVVHPVTRVESSHPQKVRVRVCVDYLGGVPSRCYEGMVTEGVVTRVDEAL